MLIYRVAVAACCWVLQTKARTAPTGCWSCSTCTHRRMTCLVAAQRTHTWLEQGTEAISVCVGRRALCCGGSTRPGSVSPTRGSSRSCALAARAGAAPVLCGEESAQHTEELLASAWAGLEVAHRPCSRQDPLEFSAAKERGSPCAPGAAHHTPNKASKTLRRAAAAQRLAMLPLPKQQ